MVLKRVLRTAPAVALAFVAGCTQWSLFEDVGSDPHPPALSVLEVVFVPPPEPPPPPEPEPEPPPEPPPVAKRARVVQFDTQGFTIRPGDSIDVLVEYFDPGADVTGIKLRDRDGILSSEFTFAAPQIDTDGDGVPDVTLDAPEFYPGARGQVHFAEPLRFDAPQLGTHRLEMWAEDSHGSRSEKVEFVVTVGYD